MSKLDWHPPTVKQLAQLTRHIRDEHSEVWSIFKRVGFREYMTRDEIAFVSRSIGNISYKLWKRECSDGHQDAKITVGLLARLADSMLSDDELEGKWVANFIADRRKVPPRIVNGYTQHGGSRPIELGWVMALAREVDAESYCWEYFSSLSQFELTVARERPRPNPIEDKLIQFGFKHCLSNRYSNLGIYPLLFAKLDGVITDITDIEQAKIALSSNAVTNKKPTIKGGFILDDYFEDLNR